MSTMTDPLALALRRLARRRRARVANGTDAPAADARALAERLDERGCAHGQVTRARLDEVSRVVDRLELKLNAVLLGVLATFVSTLVGFLVHALRGGV
jgi:phosphoglycolate phosphatase-like HAD superfamily hydrolase